MHVVRLLIDSVRIAVLVGLALMTAVPGRALDPTGDAVAADVAALWVPSLALAGLTAIFVVGALLGRVSSSGLRDQRPWTLAVEGTVAATLALVPAPQWIAWAGVTPATAAITDGWAAPLAAVWLTVVIASAVRRRSHVPTSERQSIFT